MSDREQRVSMLKTCAACIISRHWWGDRHRDNPLYKTSFDAGEMAPLFERVWYHWNLVLMKYSANRRRPVRNLCQWCDEKLVSDMAKHQDKQVNSFPHGQIKHKEDLSNVLLIQRYSHMTVEGLCVDDLQSSMMFNMKLSIGNVLAVEKLQKTVEVYNGKHKIDYTVKL